MFDWQDYFKEVASFRTICINCSEAIIGANKLANQEKRNQKAIDKALKKGKEFQKAKGKNPDVYGSNPSTSSVESEIGQMNRIYGATHPSETSKIIIGNWIAYAGKRLVERLS